MHRKEHEKFSAGDVRRVSAGRCSSRKLRTGWMAGLCLFGMLLFLTGCGKKPAQAGPKPSGGTTSKVESTDKSTSALPEDIDFTALDEDKKEQLLKTLVQDSYTFEGEVNDGPADRTDVSYHVPKICSDSAGAKEINQAIAQACEDVTSQKEDDYVGWIEVDYDSYLNGDTLSLVLTKSSNLDDYTEYYAYNLNLTDGTRMSAKELAQLLVRGVPTDADDFDDFDDDEDDAPLTLELQSGETVEAALLRVIRRAAAYEFDQSVRYMYDSDYYSSAGEAERQSLYAEFMKYRMQTLADDNITSDLPMYLDDDGELVVAVPVHVMAGGGLYNCELKPMQTIYQYDAASGRVLSGEDWEDRLEDAREAGTSGDVMNAERHDLKLSFDDALFVNYEDGRMTVRIEQNEWTEAAFGVGSIDYGKEYEVDGVYKDYVSAELLTIMHGEHVVPTFVSNDGMIAYLDLYHGAWGGHFCLTEPACGIVNVEAIGEGNAGEIAAALEKNMFGSSDTFSRTVMGLYENEGCTTETSFDTDAGTSYTDSFYLGFDPNDPSKFLYQDACVDAEIYLNYEGRCTWLGMNGQGLVFCVEFYDEDLGQMHYSSFQIRRVEELNEKTDEWYEYMRYQHLGGYDLFGSDDEVRELSLAMGDATAADAAEKEESMSTGNLAVTGTFVDGGMLSAADRAAMIVLENDAYSQFAKLTATETLTDVRIYTLEMDFEAGSDDIYFHGTEKSSIPKLAAGQSIYLQLSFPGDTPHHGISFVDANGTPRCFSMMMSGFDGSLALSEEKAFT
ncbi:hypothetical protein [Oribacterium sp. Sow4_G1_1]|uniref:hypothetical protein n=1 Tax=Oribacterium sp. Sow4_G1_1 TaxID=3438794 RepID=UPI003F9A4E44